METLESLKRRVRAAEDLHSLVRTMKALAAVTIRQLERAVESLAEYNRTVELGFRAVLRQRGRVRVTSRTAPMQPVGIIVFGSDQGMCGQLNDQIVAYATEYIHHVRAQVGRCSLLAVGTRAAARLQDTGESPEITLPIASSTSGITPLVQDILLHIDRWHSERHVSRVVVFYCEHVARAAYRPRRLELLPIDRRWLEELQREKWPTHVLPTFTVEPDRLFSALVQQYLFVSLYRACAESLASENASRLAAMRGAERNIGERIADLTRQFHQTRQMAITEELLDIAAGFEALSE